MRTHLADSIPTFPASQRRSHQVSRRPALIPSLDSFTLVDAEVLARNRGISKPPLVPSSSLDTIQSGCESKDSIQSAPQSTRQLVPEATEIVDPPSNHSHDLAGDRDRVARQRRTPLALKIPSQLRQDNIDGRRFDGLHSSEFDRPTRGQLGSGMSTEIKHNHGQPCI